MEVWLCCKGTCHVIMSKNDTHASSWCCLLVTPRPKIELVELFMKHQIPAADLGRRLGTTSGRDWGVAEWICATSCAEDQQNRYHGEWLLQCEVLAVKPIFIEAEMMTHPHDLCFTQNTIFISDRIPWNTAFVLLTIFSGTAQSKEK